MCTETTKRFDQMCIIYPVEEEEEEVELVIRTTTDKTSKEEQLEMVHDHQVIIETSVADHMEYVNEAQSKVDTEEEMMGEGDAEEDEEEANIASPPKRLKTETHMVLQRPKTAGIVSKKSVANKASTISSPSGLPTAYMPCPKCDKLISNKKFADHMEIHNEDKKGNFKCHVCAASFSNYSQLAGHSRIHKTKARDH